MSDLQPRPVDPDDLEGLRRAIRSVAEDAALRLVVLFGSSTRDSEAAEDLDLAIEAGRLLDTIDMTNRLARALGRSDVDVVDLRRADPVLALAVAEGGMPLYESEPTSFARFQSLAFRRFHDTRKFREMEHREIHDRLHHMGTGE